MSEVGGPVEDLIAKGPISKYAHGVPAVTGGPIPEMLTDVIIQDRKTNKGPDERGRDSEMSFASFLKDK